MRLLILLALALASPVAMAGVSSQAAINVMGSKTVSEKMDLGMAGVLFMTPGNMPTHFQYVGPGFQLTDWWWSSPRGGLVLNWSDSDSATFMLSWWNFLSLRDGAFTFFVETTALRTDHQYDYLSVYQASFNVDWWRVGGQVEQVNTGVTVGPHVGARLNDHLSTNLQYHWDLNEGHTLRGVTTLRFN